MLTEKVEKALNEQINKEIYSFYLYLSMAAWTKGENLPGFSAWLEAQAEEEMMHAMKIYRYLDERGGTIRLTSIDTPPAEWDSPQNLFDEVLAHEKLVTASIHDLVKVARGEDDVAAEVFLQWFVTEQVEEEASVGEVVDDMKRLGDSTHGLFMKDRELGRRGATTALFNPALGGGEE